MPKVFVRKEEDLESALRRFRRQVNDADILNQIRRHEYFMSKADIRKEAEQKRRAKSRRKGF